MQKCFSLFRPKLVHFHTTRVNNKNHVIATADKRHLPRACWWPGCRSRVSWPCWEWNLIELPRAFCDLQNLPVLLNQLLFPIGYFIFLGGYSLRTPQTARSKC